MMHTRREAVQQMLDWLESHLDISPTLPALSRQVGYSPWYCSGQFHAVTGITLKAYVSGRRLSRAAVEIRDSRRKILDIAADCGFSSQQALTRAFVQAFGCTPASYRKNPGPVTLRGKKEVLFPHDYEGEIIMSGENLSKVTVQTLYVPAHKYLCIRDPEAQAYFPFWEGRDCDGICGVIDSMSHVAHPVLGCHTAGWFYRDGKKGYSYGIGVPAGYSGEIPAGFEALDYPAGYYLVFSHPPFDFLKDCASVMEQVEGLAWGFDPAQKGFCWNEGQCQDYQLHRPEDLGYQVWRPVKPLAAAE